MSVKANTEAIYDAETAGATVCAAPTEAPDANAAPTGNADVPALKDNERSAADPSSHTPAADPADKATRPEKATYTADEVRALLQSEGDRRVAGAKKKWERETEEKIAASAEELARSMTDSLRSEADSLRRALGESEAARTARERELSLVSALGERGLPGELLPLILPTEAGKEGEIIDTLCTVIADCAKREVEARLKSSAPAAASGKRLPTADEVRTLPVAKLAELMR